MLIEMLSDWKIQERVYLILRDNGPNIVKATELSKIANEGCFLHTLALTIDDAIFSQRMVKDVVAVCRNIVKHFNHSALATDKLKISQTDLSMKKKKLIQDVPTCWNSTYYMIRSIQENKRALCLMAADSNFQNLNQHQWNLLESVLALLQPFEEITKIISSDWSCISEVIPNVSTLTRYLEKPDDLHAGVGTMKSELKASINQRFSHIYEKNCYLVATFLDPRFKLPFIPEPSRQKLKHDLTDLILSSVLESVPVQSTSASTSSRVTNEANLATQIHKSFWTCFEEISTGGTAIPDLSSDQRRDKISAEIHLYSSTEPICRKENPFDWWSANKLIFPNLGLLARCYLCSPSSTVYSERLFSEEGNIYESKRNRQLPINGEYLGFLHHNLKRLDYKY